MSQIKHPDYDTLPIIVGGKAQPGAFYVTYAGHYLSHIANDAYGHSTPTYIMKINKSKYNIEHCIYRESASGCSSAKVTNASVIIAQPNNWNAKAWISLCNVDKAGKDGYGVLLGTPYQIMWIPTADGKEPQDLEPVEETPIVARPPSLYKMPEIPKGTVTLPGFSIHIGDDESPSPAEEEKAPSDGGEPVEEEAQKAGFPWWLGALLGGGALITVIVFAVRDKKKGKKGKSK